MAGPYLPILALSRSQQIRIGDAQGGVGGNKVPGEVGTDILASGTGVLGPIIYVDLSDGSSRRDLQRHGAVGGYIVVGGLTATNATVVVTSGVLTTADGADLVITVSAGQLKNRLTGVVVQVAGGTTTLSAAHATLYRRDLIAVNNTTGAVTHVTGTNAATALLAQTPAALAGTTGIASIIVAPTVTVINQGDVTDVAPRV